MLWLTRRFHHLRRSLFSHSTKAGDISQFLSCDAVAESTLTTLEKTITLFMSTARRAVAQCKRGNITRKGRNSTIWNHTFRRLAASGWPRPARRTVLKSHMEQTQQNVRQRRKHAPEKKRSPSCTDRYTLRGDDSSTGRYTMAAELFSHELARSPQARCPSGDFTPAICSCHNVYK